MSALEHFLTLLDTTEPPGSGLAQACLDQAEALICGYLIRDELPITPRMERIQANLALILYNRRGAEGETRRSEGEVTSWFEPLPEVIRAQLRPYLKAKALSLAAREEG